MCDRAPHPETQQHRSPGESHPRRNSSRNSTPCLASGTTGGVGGGGTSPPRRRYLFLKPYFFLS